MRMTTPIIVADRQSCWIRELRWRNRDRTTATSWRHPWQKGVRFYCTGCGLLLGFGELQTRDFGFARAVSLDLVVDTALRENFRRPGSRCVHGVLLLSNEVDSGPARSKGTVTVPVTTIGAAAAWWWWCSEGRAKRRARVSRSWKMKAGMAHNVGSDDRRSHLGIHVGRSNFADSRTTKPLAREVKKYSYQYDISPVLS